MTMPTPERETIAPRVTAADTATGRSLRLQRASLRHGKLVFSDPKGFDIALHDGCFFLDIPEGLNLLPGITLSREFYRDPGDADPSKKNYRGFRQRAGVYFDREHFQTEHVLIDGVGREQHFPPELVAMCNEMNAIAIHILRHVMAALGIPEHLWDEASGGAVNNRGTHWFASSHYRSERNLLGCAPHKDTGFVTVLYMDQEGLEAYVESGWASIDPVPGCFVINFGGALEILMRQTRIPVKAILHRVRRILPKSGTEDRFSFAAFANPPPTGTLYQAGADGTLTRYQSVEEFLTEFNKATWNDRHDNFGIKVATESCR